jgi:hypothetical protein
MSTDANVAVLERMRASLEASMKVVAQLGDLERTLQVSGELVALQAAIVALKAAR